MEKSSKFMKIHWIESTLSRNVGVLYRGLWCRSFFPLSCGLHSLPAGWTDDHGQLGRLHTQIHTLTHRKMLQRFFFFVVSSMSATRSDPSAHSVPSVQSAESIWTCSERTSSWLTIVHNSSPQMALIWWYTRKTVASVTEPIVWDCVRWRRSERRSHWRGWRWELVNKFKSNQI